MIIDTIEEHIVELDSMKKYPDELFYIGNLELLQKPKIAIVGSRKPIQYTCNMTAQLSQKLSDAGVTIVSGSAMGVDAIAHKSAGFDNTIAVMANGLDIFYPMVNKSLIQNIQSQGLVLSKYKAGQTATKYNFVHRNEIVVALGNILIITQADIKSGSMRSAEYAKKMGKEIYVLTHRMMDSEGTNKLLQDGLAKPIYDIDAFIENLGLQFKQNLNEFMTYCNTMPTYDEAIKLYPQEVFEYELSGKIKIQNGIISIL